MSDPLNIKAKKVYSKFKNDSTIKECFHFKNEECSNRIISAHSLQRSGVLDILEDEISGNKVIYSFCLSKLILNDNNLPIGFEPIGKKEASTFFGFCGYHDMEIFKEIENKTIDITNDEHCFLLSYRAFAREFHIKNQSIKGCETNEYFNDNIPKEEVESLLEGSKLASIDGIYVKNRMNDILLRKSFDELEYFTYELEYIIPIAVSSSITPEYDLRGRKFNFSLDPKIRYQYINIVVQPAKDGKTKIIFSCLPEDLQAVDFLDDLNSLKDYFLHKRISSLIIGYIENVFFSPKLWKSLTMKERSILFTELLETNPIIRATKSKIFNSHFNFLNSKYKLN
jgi:hypothetical protein